MNKISKIRQPKLIETSNGKPRLKTEFFGETTDGTAVNLFTIENSNGTKAKFINYGAILQSLEINDSHGAADVVLGYDNLAAYETDEFYFGCIVGRYANRISEGKFRLDEKNYQLACNNGGNHLHGGNYGFGKKIWEAQTFAKDDGAAGVRFSRLSPDGEENYPGNLSVEVIYTLTADNDLKIQYAATTDQKTIINLTNHSYFNLAGAGNTDILRHKLKIFASRFTPLDSAQIPLDEMRKVKNTPFDFTESKIIGSEINEPDEQLLIGKGYDHNFVLDEQNESLRLAAEVCEPISNRRMQIFTTCPGMQFYTGNFLHNISGKDGKIYNARHGFCLEAQYFPDSPNQSQFPSTILLPKTVYRQTTIYRFF